MCLLTKLWHWASLSFPSFSSSVPPDFELFCFRKCQIWLSSKTQQPSSFKSFKTKRSRVMQQVAKRTVKEWVTALTVAPSRRGIKLRVCHYKTDWAAWHRVLSAAVQTVSQITQKKSFGVFDHILHVKANTSDVPEIFLLKYLHKPPQNMSIFSIIRIFYKKKNPFYFNCSVFE